MAFRLPAYNSPDFDRSIFRDAPAVTFKRVARAGVAPDGFHATTIFPEYFQIRKDDWRLLMESRMDCVVVLNSDGTLEAREFRRLKKGDRVACGRRENGEDGIFVHVDAFSSSEHDPEKFTFRSHRTRETSFSI